jgi:aminoglycoside phosphotransferase (APT) family kinase protein
MQMTSEPALPRADRIEAVLTAPGGPWETGSRVLETEDLSPGLGQSAVLRVHMAERDGASRSSWIVKIPGIGARSLLDSRDERLDDREVAFFRSVLPARLPAGVSAPSDATVLDADDRDWIVMRDIAHVLQRPWTPDAATRAAARIALLHAPIAVDPDLLASPWLEREGHAAYTHHVPSGHVNLDALAVDPRLADLFTPKQILALHHCLDAAEALNAKATRLPQTLVHGDFHTRNAGMDAEGTLVLIDWEHAGVGPAGFDLGTFVAVYQAFGGLGALDEQALLKTYGRALAEVGGADLYEAAAVGFAIAHLTWGLHLRLGPGLAAVRHGYLDGSPAERASALEDIRSGCLRALSWAAVAGVDTGA